MTWIKSAPTNSVLSGVRLGVFGSSSSDDNFMGRKYYRYIQDRTGLIPFSVAKAGTLLKPATQDYTADTDLNGLRQIDSLSTDLDMVVGQVAVNDERFAHPLGTFNTTSPPTAAPTLTTATTGGSLAVATYYVCYSWTSSGGETLVSPEATITTTGTTSTVTATIPALPTGVTVANIYIGTAAGTGTKQGTTATTTFTQSAALAAGASRSGWTVYMALHKMCQKMLDKWSTQPLGIMTGQYFGDPATGLITVQSSTYHSAIIEVCSYYGIPTVDLAKEGRTPYSYQPFKSTFVNTDGLHLTDAGNQILSYRVESFYNKLMGR